MSMLRSSKFVKTFVSFARSIAISPVKAVDRTLLERSKALAFPSYRTLARSVSSPLSGNGNSSLDLSIQRLDQDVRRTGRISAKELLGVFDEIRLTRQATSSQSLMIIRCCGNLVPEESPEVRTKLVKEIWDTFEKMGVALDISHYNALLRVYLENEHDFSPLEFLANLEQKGVEPNRVTFQRLVAAYCQKGDIEGATQILEFMKDKQIPVNEAIFNSLITGHSQADDMDSAAGILTVMKQANLEPSADTYTSLLCGYARKGDVEAIKKLLAECKGKDIDMSDKHILEIVFALAVNGHSQHFNEVFDFLKKSPGYNQNAKNVILRLIMKGKDEAAVQVLKTMTSVINKEGTTQPVGTFLVKQLVKARRPVDFIIRFCEELMKSGQNERALHSAVEASLSQKTPEMSRQLLSALAGVEPVCQHYYWPVLVQYGKMDNFQGVQATLKQMSDEVDQPISGETLKDYVVPYLKDADRALQDLRRSGIPLPTASAATVAYLLSKNKIEEAAKFAIKYRANYNNLNIRKALVSAFVATKDVDNFVTIVQAVVEGESEEESDPSGKLLEELTSALKKDKAILIGEILQRYLDCGLGIGSETANTIQEKLGEELNSDISNLLAQLTSPDLTPVLLSRPAPSRTTMERGVASLIRQIENAQSRGEPTLGLKKQLFFQYCHDKDLDNAVKIKQELEQEGFEFQIGMHALLMDLYIHEGKLAEAMACLEKIKGLDSLPDDSKMIKLASLICSERGPTEAINFVKKYPLSSSENKQGFSNVALGWKLLNSVAESKDADALKALFDALVENKYVEPQNVVLGPLIKVHLLRDDLDSAMKQFEECCLKYRATPWKREIARRLIEVENASALQRLTDLSTEVHGEINSLYDLVLCFIECGRVRQARRILETPGLKSRSQKLYSACQKYGDEGSVNYLERLVEVTKDLHHIDRSDIYYHLLSSYCKADDVEKAFGLWTQMQDEDVQPSDQFLAKLGALLKKHDRVVPFKVPDVSPELPKSSDVQTAPKSTKIRMFRKALNARDVDAALEMKEKIPDSSLTQLDRSRLITQLFASGRINEGSRMLVNWLEQNLPVASNAISSAINTLAKIGDLDSLSSIEKCLNTEMKKKVSFINRWTHCMVEAGKAPEVIASLRKSIAEAKTPKEVAEVVEAFPRGGLHSVLNSRPDLVEEVEQLAAEYLSKGSIEPTNILWSYYVINGDVEKAEKAWAHLKTSERIMFLPITSKARETRDLGLVEQLLNKCREAGVRPRALGSVYSTIIEILLLNGEEEIAKKRFEEALKICALEDIHLRVLRQLKTSLVSRGLQFPYDIEARRNRANTSDSSSSDSDSEETSKTLKSV